MCDLSIAGSGQVCVSVVDRYMIGRLQLHRAVSQGLENDAVDGFSEFFGTVQ